MKEFFAHSLDSRPIDEWHLLEDHLNGTAELARSFADVFGYGNLAYIMEL